ncbi:MAG TPA: single-stranded-DNA-specific exonuclease RecJ, partial [Planctomycetota bacterium]|nr:single-stranded-DNA-specific exonuclease RecJ [Planctomycetota bacterium]
GDYDVDGVTGTTLLVRLLRHLGAQVHWHIPSRFDDGYSFGEHSLRKAAQVGAQVVVSVDNGTSSADIIAALSGMGVDTIVTDHHEPPKGALPQAVAIINPKLDGCPYPFRELCGAAVAFKLAWGLCQRITGSDRVRPDLRDFLVDAMGLVAIATVCDVVPLEKENRILAHYGLKALAAARTPGFRALLQVTGLEGRVLTAEDVAFQIGPRINAAGRLDSAARAVEVLLAESQDEALRAARLLDDLNLQRRALERELTQEAMIQAEAYGHHPEFPVIVLGGAGWHQGLVGIVAARLVDRFHKPAIVFGFEGEEGRGSARSIPGFSVLDAMHGAREQFSRYGGHEQAAGGEVRFEDLETLRESVNQRAREMLERDPLPIPTLEIDFDLPFEHMVEESMRAIERLEPFGSGYEQPVLLSRDLRLAEAVRRVGPNGEHLMLRVRRGEVVHRAMFFGQGERADELQMGLPLHLVYTPRRNTFRGQTELQLLVRELHVGDAPPLQPA